MSHYATPDLDTGLKTLSQHLASHFGVDEEVLAQLGSLQENHALEGLPQVGISTDILVPITSGHGSYISDTYHTVWATVRGTAVITEPDDGTSWRVVATDIAQNRTIFTGSGSKGTVVPFTYSTGWSFQARVEAWCSNVNENTTLKIHVEVNL